MEYLNILETVDGSSGTVVDLFWWRTAEENVLVRDGVEMFENDANATLSEVIP